MTPDPRFLLFGLVALVLTLVVGTLTAYLLAEKELKTLGKVTHTELGTVEYLRQGKGPAVVIVHGSPGGYDQFLTLGTLLSRYGYEVISVSRPGYLRTPLGKNKTPHQQAALIVALLSRLSIKRASIIGISGGGPAAISLAINYPERTSALILIAALSGQAFSNEAGRGDGGLLANDLGFFVAQTFPSHFMSLLGSIEPEDSQVVVSEDERLILASELFRSLGFRSLRNAGYQNDVEQFYYRSINANYSRITSPVLLIYGEKDSTVPLTHARFLRSHISQAKLTTLPTAGHALFVTHANVMMRTLVRFMGSE